ncbi:hypothetical protein GOODEAATRI_019908 [Goodea atripinnis]|uniref:Uncharacterized protein n=1 Tax=Goodea atripinnis TaxID=208336 RepID=A0ABV0NLP8_9TELE
MLQYQIKSAARGHRDLSLGWDAVTKHQLFLQRFSSRLGPGVRQQGRTNRPDRGPAPPPGSGTGPPGQEHSEPGASEESRVVEADGSLAKNQNQGIPKPRTSAIAHNPTASIPKPTSNQQPAAGSAGRQPAPTASRLPVKGLPGSLSCSSLGSNENNAANSKASPGAPPPTDSKPDVQPSRGSPSSGSQNTAKPHNSGITSATGDISSSSGPMPPAAGMRSRAPSVQARTSTTGENAQMVSNLKPGHVCSRFRERISKTSSSFIVSVSCNLLKWFRSAADLLSVITADFLYAYMPLQVIPALVSGVTELPAFLEVPRCG